MYTSSNPGMRINPKAKGLISSAQPGLFSLWRGGARLEDLRDRTLPRVSSNIPHPRLLPCEVVDWRGMCIIEALRCCWEKTWCSAEGKSRSDHDEQTSSCSCTAGFSLWPSEPCHAGPNFCTKQSACLCSTMFHSKSSQETTSATDQSMYVWSARTK